MEEEAERRRQEVEEKQLTRSALPQTADTYTDRLLKLIPAESVALYLTLQGIVSSSVEGRALDSWLLAAFCIGIGGTRLYLWRVQQVTKNVQLAVSTAAFGVWVFVLGGAFAAPSQRYLGTSPSLDR